MATPSAVDQYTQHLPTANGGSAAGGAAGAAAPVARPGLLPARTLAALHGPDGELLKQIATARDLGAPEKGGSSKRLGSSDKGFVTVAAESVGGASSVILLVALIAISVVAVVVNRRRLSSDRL